MKPTRDELIELFATFDTDRLLGMLNNPDEFTEEALQIAQAELSKRKVGESEIQHYLSALGVSQAESRRKATSPLTFSEKTFFFFLWFTPTFISIALGMDHFDDGYDRKAQQGRFFRLTGFALLVLTLCLSIMFRFDEIPAIALLIFFFGLSYYAEHAINRR